MDDAKLLKDRIEQINNMSQDELDFEVKESLAVNLMFRNSAFQRMTDPRRDIDAECGYIDTQNLSAGKFRDYYLRDPIARRVVDIYPEECWSLEPEVYAGEDKDAKNPFNESWKELNKSLRGKSWFNDDKEGSPIWEHLQRVDRLSGIGH